MKRFIALLTLVVITLALPTYARHTKHQLNPEAKAAQKRARARAKEMKKAAKQAAKRHREDARH